MNASLKGKLVAGFILAFLAGGAAGAFFTVHHAGHWRADFARHSDSIAERTRDRIKSELDLTPEQMAKVEPILDHTVSELQQVRAETGGRVRRIMSETNQALKPLLSDTQLARLEKIEQSGRAKRVPGNQGRHRDARAGAPDQDTPQN